MYTKFLLLTVIFLLVDTTTISIGSNGLHSLMHVSIFKAEQQRADEQEKMYPKPGAVATNGVYYYKPYTPSLPAEEDGKPHFFHFNRLDKRRWGNLMRLIAKVVLLITHVAVLVNIINHLLH